MFSITDTFEENEIIDIITSTSHELVVGNDGRFVVEDNQVLIRSKKNTADVFYIPINEEVREIFGYNIYNELINSSGPQNVCSEKSSIGIGLKWSQNDIRKLISLYEKYEKEFQSTATRNEKVWQKISIEMVKFTAKQCSDKFKYLKQRYMKKKDNMGTTESGAEFYKFQYFEEFDKIFGKKPNVKPLSIASSTRGDSVTEVESCEENMETSTDEGPMPKRKKNGLDKLIQYFREKNEQDQRDRERRHKEKMELFQKIIDKL